MRAAFFQVVLVLALQGPLVNAAQAESFKYYVWIDAEGIVHAEEKPPKGVDYQVRIIEDINANVIPAEDFRLYGDLPADYDHGTGDQTMESAAGANPATDDAGEPAVQDSPEVQR